MHRDLHITVAAVVERGGAFLFVEERVAEELRINQPAGHLETGENLLQAVIREAREETGREFEPDGVLGVYLWRVPGSDLTYLRIAFRGRIGERQAHLSLDSGIERTLWLRRDEIVARQTQWRSPLVLRCVDDYLVGRHYPLDVLVDLLQHA